MKKIFCLFISLLAIVSAFGQKDWRVEVDFAKEDSIIEALGYIPQQYEFLSFGKRGCYQAPKIIDNDSLLGVFKLICGFNNKPAVDLSTHVLLNVSFGGDCHMKLRHYVYLDTLNRKLVWRVYNIYGGCRAGGQESFLMKVPKPPAGYEIAIEEILVERVKGKIEDDK